MTPRIDIVGDESIDHQTRTYAEYRLFAALAPSIDMRQFRRASLVLRRTNGLRQRERILCAVAVELDDGSVTRFKAAGDHPYQAINRAVERVRQTSWPLLRGPHGGRRPPLKDAIAAMRPIPAPHG
jgi:hypothetical protein